MSLSGSGNMNTKNEKEVYHSFAVLLFFFFLITVLPQMLYIERGNVGGTQVKALLLVSFYVIALLMLLRKKIKINEKELLVGLLFLAVQLFANIIPSQYTHFSSAIMINIAIATSYYLFLESFFSRLRLERDDIALFARLYQIFILYACVVNVVTNWSIIPSLITSLNGYAFTTSSFFSNRNTFALFLLAGVILSIYRLKIKNKNLTDICLLAFIIFNLILTLSRTSLLGMLVFFIVIRVFRDQGKEYKGIFKLLAIGAMFISLITVSGLADFFINSVLRADVGSTGRIEIWEAVGNIYKNSNLLTGVGMGISDFITIHNTYLSILLYGGIFFIAFYIRVFVRFIKLCSYILKQEYDIGIYFVASLLAFFSVTLTETCIPFFSSSQAMIYTILVFMIPRYYANTIMYNNLKKDDDHENINHI